MNNEVPCQFPLKLWCLQGSSHSQGSLPGWLLVEFLKQSQFPPSYYLESKCERVLGTTWKVFPEPEVFIKIGIYAYLLSENSEGRSLDGAAYDIWTKREVVAFLQHDGSRMHEVFHSQLDTLAESQWKLSRKDPTQEGCLLGQGVRNRKNWRCNAVGRTWQQNYKWSGLEPLSGYAAINMVGYAKGDEEARACLKNVQMLTITESQHLDAWHNRGHIWADLKELKKWAFVPSFMVLLLPCPDLWGDRVGGGWGEVEQTKQWNGPH